ncbi:hypothetical protein QE388_000795 [Microbacterium sp. SORGH_AS 969]|nr:hypothetical protein [Microbacterium sp. SORGH_AS_0969]
MFHIEAFVIPHRRKIALADIENAREGCVALDGKIQDVVVAPVPALPDIVDAITVDAVTPRGSTA